MIGSYFAAPPPQAPAPVTAEQAYLQKYGKAIGGPAKLPSPGGTGLAFLGGLSLRGRGLLDDSTLLDPFSGNRKELNTPFLQARFLAGEMGPGGALAPDTQSYETALGVNGILGSARQKRERALALLTSTGLSGRYAGSMADVYDSVGMEEALKYQAAQHGELSRQRYNAMSELINSISQTAAAEKANKLNAWIAKKGADATTAAGVVGGLGQIAGAAIGAAALTNPATAPLAAGAAPLVFGGK